MTRVWRAAMTGGWAVVAVWLTAAAIPALAAPGENAPATNSAAAGTNAFEWSWEKPSNQGTPGSPSNPGISVESYEKLVKDNLDLRNQLDQAARNYSTLKKENAMLLLQSEETEQKRQNMAAALKNLKSIEDLENELAKVRTEKARLEDDLAKLKSSPAAGVTPAGTATGVVAQAAGEGSDLVRRLQREIADLQNQLAITAEAQRAADQARQQSTSSGAHLQSRVEQLQAERDRLQGVLEERQSQDKQAMRRLALMVKDARMENERLRGELDKARQGALPGQVELATGDTTGKGAASPGVAASPGLLETAAASPGSAKAKRDALLNLGVKFTRSAQYNQAAKAYQLMLKMDPSDADAHYNLGILYGEYLDEPARAAAQYRAYVALTPDAADADLVSAWALEMELKAARQ